jgi:hypothetical protein
MNTMNFWMIMISILNIYLLKLRNLTLMILYIETIMEP